MTLTGGRKAAYDRAYRAAHYAPRAAYQTAYRAAHQEQVRANRVAYTAANRAVIRDAKAASGCVDCGERDPIVLDFDHVRGRKVRNVGMMYSSSTAALLAEIAKCEVRCANCHRRATHSRRQKAA